MQIQFAWSKKREKNDSSSSQNLKWRPFQIGFALMSLQGLCNGNHPDRNNLDLYL